MTAQPRRRWFRFAFTLRTAFVIITCVAAAVGYVTWQVRIVEERRFVLRELQRVDADDFEYNELRDYEDPRRFEFARIAWLRQRLGDVPCESLQVPRQSPPQLIERAEKAFPEAELWIYQLHYNERPSYRDSLYAPMATRMPNAGSVFKTGLTEKTP